ncbi:MAG: hypothetical protein Ta2A_25850 [Treponemataceae bacterium]|nr:MAG: hypothetical protein Ta2A_25850 [Treponemataceae bacterium]
MSEVKIDVAFDLSSDLKGCDPDTYSQILKQYHKQLWNKPLPNGSNFTLECDWGYLCHKSGEAEHLLSSDTMVNTYGHWTRKAIHDICVTIPKEEMQRFVYAVNTIGNRILFPRNRIDGKNTINQDRYFAENIRDRFDLTLECVRRYYADIENPLKDTFQNYKKFFDLFTDFKGYCKFFLLQDLVSEDCSQIKFFLPFDNFESNPLPTNEDEYRRYMQKSMEFISCRNARIATDLKQRGL